MRGRLRRWAANFGVLITSLGLAGLGLEGAVRWFDPQPANRYRFSADTYYEPVPGARFVYRRREFAVPVAYNALGMRDPERHVERVDSRVLRVALVGDSQVEAKEVPLDSTFGQRLEIGLASRLDRRPVEVLNFGVSGYGTAASAIRYRRLGSRFQPDLVLYVFMDNDLGDNLGRDAQLFTLDGQGVVYHRLAAGPLRGVLDVVKHHAQSYAFLKFRLAQIGTYREAPADRAPGASDRAWETFVALMRDLRAATAATGAQFAVVQAGTDTAVASRLAALCRELELPYLDLEPALRAAPAAVRWTHDGHWRSSAHRVAAEELAPFAAGLLLPAQNSVTRQTASP